ncbi:hypothetical protein [Bosea sp. (in: a-proteobacteria)]|uniref:hypothetical protein n=1 Tax=Bosea sp. (in: a-proteobacteria) TaxID=1871050 RepID=UPI00262D247F|nr:hypothetical protein [Bosea sp. (in: a-proteobacteria)]MCO5092707.1 hypothetical protein [Bosea sp. (in: a-proteobacteria)]
MIAQQSACLEGSTVSDLSAVFSEKRISAAAAETVLSTQRDAELQAGGSAFTSVGMRLRFMRKGILAHRC